LSKALLGVVAAAILAGAFWLAHVLFPSDEERIRRLLAELAQTSEVRPNEPPLAQLAHANKLIGFFASDVEIQLQDVPADWAHIVGRDQLREIVLAGRSHLQQWRVAFLGFSILRDPTQPQAQVSTTATAEVNGEKNAIVQELRFTLQRTDRRWLISRVETISTLRR
jgi:hypothetical protein